MSQVPPRLAGRRAGGTEATSSAVVYLALLVLLLIFILTCIIDEKISDNLRNRKKLLPVESYAVLYSFTEKTLQHGEEGVEQSESESVK